MRRNNKITVINHVATLGLLCLAASTAHMGAAPAPTSPPAGLASGDYIPGLAGAAAAVSNRAVRLTVPRFRVTTSLGAQHAAAHRAFITVSTEWRNISSAPYLVPDLTNHLFLLIDGDQPATLSDATSAAPHPLVLDQLQVPANSTVAGDAVFDIRDHGATSLELLFIDTDQGDMHLPLFGHPPADQRAIAGPAGNGLIEVSILGMKEGVAAGSVHAPPGQMYAVIGIRLRGLSPGNLVRFDPTMYAVLGDEDGYSYRAVQVEALEDEFTAATQLLPLVPSRGTLAYLVPSAHSALTLAVNLPDYKAIALALPNSGPAARAGNKPVVSFEDPDTLTLSVLGLSRAASIGNKAAATGKDYLILDILFVSKVDQGIEFQTAEQLLLLDGQDEIAADPDALAALPHGLIENSVIPRQGHARFQVSYQVPMSAAHFTLRYRGFQSDSKKALPDIPAKAGGS